MSPPALGTFWITVWFTTHVFLWRVCLIRQNQYKTSGYEYSRRHTNTHTHLDERERERELQPCVITVKFVVNQTGTLAGRSGSLSAWCRAPANPPPYPCTPVPPVLSTCPCESRGSGPKKVDPASVKVQMEQLPYALLPHWQYLCPLVFWVFFLLLLVSLSEVKLECRPHKCHFLVCFLWFPPPRQVPISYKSLSVSELIISVEHICI